MVRDTYFQTYALYNPLIFHEKFSLHILSATAHFILLASMVSLELAQPETGRSLCFGVAHLLLELAPQF